MSGLKGAILFCMEAGVRELRDHLSRYLDLVREGEEVTVTDHGKAVARLVPLGRPRPLDRLIAEGLVTPGRAAKRPRSGRALKAQGTVSDLVAEQRR
jgi:prevent-host-death family protein